MSTLREVKRRIKTAKNIGQVTRAMEMVSAVKMRRAQDAALSGRDYILELEKMIRILAANKKEEYGVLFKSQKAKRITLVIVGPQKGLVGPLTTNLFRQVGRFLQLSKQETIDGMSLNVNHQASFKLDLEKNVEITFVTVEKKAKDIARMTKKQILADFGSLGRQITLSKIRPVANYLVDLYRTKQTDVVLICYSYFVNTVTQKPVIRQFLPILPTGTNNEMEHIEAKELIFEPSITEVLDRLLVSYAEGLLYQIMLDSSASEHSSRMVAMKNAHDNAKEIISQLTLDYNQTRQNAITNEIADIVSGSLISK